MTEQGRADGVHQLAEDEGQAEDNVDQVVRFGKLLELIADLFQTRTHVFVKHTIVNLLNK